jgi:hypothetical protein
MAEFQSPIDTSNVLRAQTAGTGRAIRDTSAELKAKAAEQAIGAVVKVSEAAAVAPAATDIEEGLTEFSAAKQDADLYSKLQDAATALDVAETGEDEAAINKAADDFNKYKRMVKLGNMSSGQAKLLAEDRLRRAINESPFHREALIASHASILGTHRSELAAIDAVDKATASNNAFLTKTYQKIMIDEGLDPLGKTVEEMAAIVTPIKANEASYKRIEAGEKVNENNAVNMFYGDSNNALQGAHSSFLKEINAERESFMATPGVSMEEFFFRLQSIESRYTNNLSQNFGRYVEPSHLDRGIKQFTDAREIIERSVRNDESKTWTDNNLAITKNNLQSNALRNPSFQAGYVLKELAPTWIETNALFRDNATMAKGLIDYTTDLANGSVVTQEAPTTPSGRAMVREAGKMIRDDVSNKEAKRLPTEDNELYRAIGNMADIVSQRTFSSEEMQNVLDTGSMTEIADFTANNTEFLETANKLRQGTERTLAEVLIPQLTATLNKDIKFSITKPITAGAPLAAHGPILRNSIVLEVSDTGMISFRAKPLEKVSELNKIDLNRQVANLNSVHAVNMNKAIRTLAHVNGRTDYMDAATAILMRTNREMLPEIFGVVFPEEVVVDAD